MIFVMCGTMGFEELVIKMDKLALSIKEKIIIQIGNSNYIPEYCEWFRFSPTLKPYQKEARLIICHAGAGGIYETMSMNKNLIVINNTNRTDQHQEDICKALAKDKYIVWSNLNNLQEDIKSNSKFEYAKYITPVCDINKEIERYLNEI